MTSPLYARAVTKPAVGFFDLASNLSEGATSLRRWPSIYSPCYIPKGVRNTTTVFDRPARERTRTVSAAQSLTKRAVSQYVIASTGTSRSGSSGEQLSRMKGFVAIKRNLQPFSEREALGQYWLKDVDNGAYRQEFYVAHISTCCTF